jgi:HSP20 family molecular chaperone IbpA
MKSSYKKTLQPTPKTEVVETVERTMPGTVFMPDVDIFEAPDGIALLADLPGVKQGGLSIELKNNILTISATSSIARTEKEEVLLAEYEEGCYFRQFSLTQDIDQNKIDAKLDNGVLRLTLHKAEKILPRKIEISAA